jgi:hypothetical protein
MKFSNQIHNKLLYGLFPPPSRARNDKLIPIMINRLKVNQKESEELRKNNVAGHSFKRPFQMFGTQAAVKSGLASPSKSPSRRLSYETEDGVAPLKSLNPGWPSVPSSSPSHPGDLSNSSWAEMESQMIGHFPIHPLTLSAKQVFILRFLQPLGEYQEVINVQYLKVFVVREWREISNCINVEPRFRFNLFIFSVSATRY